MTRAPRLSLAALALCALPLAGCGFTPVYGGGQGLAFATSGPIQILEVRPADSNPIGRTGHFLRQELVRSVGRGVPGFSAGALEISMKQRIDRLAFTPDLAASRSDYVGEATWTLRSTNGDIIGTGSAVERASFNFGDAAFADVAAQTGAQERLAHVLARTIRTQILIAAGKAVDPKTGKPVEPAATGQ